MKNLTDAIAGNRGTIATAWIEQLRGSLDGAIGGEAAVTVLLDKLIDALTQSVTPDLDDPAFRVVVAHMTDMSAARAREGFSPSATGRLVMGLKAAAEPALAGRPAEFAILCELVDQLCFLTFEAYMRAREEVIVRQNESILEISTPALRIWDDVVMMPLVGVIDTDQRPAHHGAVADRHRARRGARRHPRRDRGADPRHPGGAAPDRGGGRRPHAGRRRDHHRIQPEAAQTLVKLDIDFANMRTRGTLRAGFAEALRLLRRRVAAIDRGTPWCGIPILRLGNILLTSIQSDITDEIALRCRSTS